MLLDDLTPLLSSMATRASASPDDYPAADIAALVEIGALVAPFPASLGGRGTGLAELVRVIEAIAAVSPSAALLACMPLGVAGALSSPESLLAEEERAAWREQVERVAAELRAGKLYSACNSEKGAGGSLAATKTIARRDPDGVSRLTGEKILASFGTHADVFFSTAKVETGDPASPPSVEFFLVDARAPGVQIVEDWNGFGMRGTDSHSVRYEDAPARERLGCPQFIDRIRPLQYWYCLFAAIPLGCVVSMLRALGRPAPTSPALRLRLADLLARYEASRAYLLESAAAWRPSADAAYAARVLRTKTYVTQEATKMCAELFALSGGRHYVRGGRLAGALADSFAGTALRPPLTLALDMIAEQLAVPDE